ncbi:MAG: DUF2905 family protein [Dehalococcoidia bacterium]|nr:DUF2905 family protein [Dehalococcoidia bacterium]
MDAIGRVMVFAGLLIALAGGLFWLLARTTSFGKLPGDLSFGGDNLSVYVPLASMLILSLVLTVVVNVLYRVFR